ncbi:MAG: V-type ATP synthase subunit B, partial [Deltaproteobacteria bacterium]|nr:V-type ATP synthase subunit B [Deltaproteobacteria bacterium]
TMPDDDITHPIADLSGYITEGQIVLSRTLFRKGIYPPVDALPSLSRLMNLGIGREKTREDHRGLADQLYAPYAKGRDTRRLATIIGEEGLTDMDKRYLKFADEFEKVFVGQGDVDRSIDGTLSLGWRLLSMLPKTELIRIREEFVEKYYQGM